MSRKLSTVEYIAVICGCLIVGLSIGTQIGHNISKKGVKMAETTATICPNCQKPALRSGDEITCENCDATFTITKKQEGRVKDFGKIQDHDKRIERIEGIIEKAGLSKSQTPQQSESEQSEEDEDI